jgi:aspartyl-tRNA(Asn)/glutamyl-tRNA(Gln) amidotransferase subunit C
MRMNDADSSAKASEWFGPAEVRNVAELARLRLTDDEVDHFSQQLRVILGAVERIREVASADVPPMTHAVDLVNVTRPDIEWECLPRDAVLAAAPSVEDVRFRVPRILEP